MMQLVCASANPDKVAEITQLLDGLVDLLPRPSEVPDVVEDADTLVGNARLKAAAIVAASALTETFAVGQTRSSALPTECRLPMP